MDEWIHWSAVFLLIHLALVHTFIEIFDLMKAKIWSHRKVTRPGLGLGLRPGFRFGIFLDNVIVCQKN